MGPGPALVSPPPRVGVGWGVGRGKQGEKEGAGWVPEEAKQCGGKTRGAPVPTPLSAGRGVEVRGSFLPWHLDKH